MNMEITKKDAALLIGLFGLLVTVVVYYLVFMPYSQKTDILKQENTGLNTKVQILQLMANDYDSLVKKTAANKQKTEEILNRFPSDVKEEDVIMLAVELQNQGAYDAISGVSIGDPVDVYAVTDMDAKVAEVVANRLGTATSTAENPEQQTGTDDQTGQEMTEGVAAEEIPVEEIPAEEESMPGEVNLDGNYVLRERTSEITGTSSYDGFKNGLRMLTGRNDRTQITVMASYDIETGLLDSSITVISNYMTGTGKPYTAPAIPFVPQGTGNIFGTVDLTGQAEELPTEEELQEMQQ